MSIPAMSVSYGPGDFDPPDPPEYEDEPDSERDFASLLATMPPEEADEEPVTLYGLRDYSTMPTDHLPLVNWAPAQAPAEKRREEIAAYNARHARLQRRYPRARFRFEWTGRRAVAYLYTAPGKTSPLSTGVASGPRFDAMREAASRAMDAAGFRLPVGDEEARP